MPYIQKPLFDLNATPSPGHYQVPRDFDPPSRGIFMHRGSLPDSDATGNSKRLESPKGMNFQFYKTKGGAIAHVTFDIKNLKFQGKKIGYF